MAVRIDPANAMQLPILEGSDMVITGRSSDGRFGKAEISVDGLVSAAASAEAAAVQTGLDRDAAETAAAQAAADRDAVEVAAAQTAADREATGNDVEQTGLNVASANSAALAAQIAADNAVASFEANPRYAVPRVADAVEMVLDNAGTPVDVATEFVRKSAIVPNQVYAVPRIGTAQSAVIGSGGAVVAATGEFGEVAAAFPTGDYTADVGGIEERMIGDCVTGRVLPQISQRLSLGTYAQLTGGHLPARLLGYDPANGLASVRRGGVASNARWRPSRLGTGGVMHMLLIIGQSNAVGNMDLGADDRRPLWRGQVSERAWQFKDASGIQRGPRPLQVDPVSGNKGVAISAGQLTQLEPLRGSRHAGNAQYTQTSAESAALALIGQHLHVDDEVLGCVIGTGSTAIAYFAPASVHYVNAQAAITAAQARATERALALKVWLIWNQGEEDNSAGTTQASYQASWLAIRDGLSAHTVSAGGTFGGTVIQQTLQRPSGATGMATLAHAALIAAGHAVGVVPQTCQPGFSGSTHYQTGTQLPLGSATAASIANILAAPSAISSFVAAASKGVFFTPRIMRQLWQTDDTLTPVSAVGQAVGRIEGTGFVAPMSYSQATSGSRPALAAGGLIQFDGTADYLAGDANMLAFAQNIGAITYFARVKTGTLGGTQVLFNFGTGGVASTRVGLQINVDGKLGFMYRRTDGGAFTSVNTGSAWVTSNTTYSIMLVVDFSGGTANLYIDDSVDRLGATLISSGLTSNTASLSARVGCNSATTPASFLGGSLGRFGFATSIPTAAERTAIFAELARDAGETLSPHVASGDAVLSGGTQIDCRISGGTGTYVFDTTTMIADAAGTYGVRVEGDSGSLPISAIALTSANNLRITLASATTLGDNPRVEFGLFGPAGMTTSTSSRVNIRDDSAWPCPCTGQIISGWMMHHRVSVS